MWRAIDVFSLHTFCGIDLSRCLDIPSNFLCLNFCNNHVLRSYFHSLDYHLSSKPNLFLTEIQVSGSIDSSIYCYITDILFILIFISMLNAPFKYAVICHNPAMTQMLFYDYVWLCWQSLMYVLQLHQIIYLTSKVMAIPFHSPFSEISVRYVNVHWRLWLFPSFKDQPSEQD